MVEWPDYKSAPMQWFVCDACDGYGYEGRTITVYEPGCAWSRKDTEEWPCSHCGGDGGWIAEVEPDRAPYDPTSQPYDEPFTHVDRS